MTNMYRKKPVVISAVQWSGDPAVNHETPEWYVQAIREQAIRFKLGERAEDKTALALIETLEGLMTAQPGDWIIRGVKGEIYPCKPDIFAATYEPVEEPCLNLTA